MLLFAKETREKLSFTHISHSFLLQRLTFPKPWQNWMLTLIEKGDEMEFFVALLSNPSNTPGGGGEGMDAFFSPHLLPGVYVKLN